MRVRLVTAAMVPAIAAGAFALIVGCSAASAAEKPVKSPEWYVWRILLREFLSGVAFLPRSYAAR